MIDLKEELKKITKIPVANVAFINKTTLPFICIVEDRRAQGADQKSFIYERNIDIELYSQKLDKNIKKIIEQFIEENLNNEYEVTEDYLSDERCYMTRYSTIFYEKIGGKEYE